MKYITGLLAAACMMMASCDDKLDYTPLGMSTLDTVSDLETLLNQPWYIFNGATSLEVLANNTYPEKYKKVEAMLTNKNTISYALLACDESVDRADLSTDDNIYDKLYGYIQYPNVIIAKAPEADGDGKLRSEIIAESRVLRAWFHFLAVNIYAKQYDESTAATDGGVAYVDNINAQELKEKRTVAYVYQRILEDCADEVIAAVPQRTGKTTWRGGADFANAVRALVLFQMKHYDQALEYCNRALAINDVIGDRQESLSSGNWTVDFSHPNNYLHFRGTNTNLGEYSAYILTPEASSKIEQYDYLLTFSSENGGWDRDSGYGLPGSYVSSASGVQISSFGIRTENVIYTAAECLIRTGHIKDGLAMVDRVRAKRVANAEPFAERTDITTEEQAMALLQDAKRVEMFTTCFNYLDCKRWNSEAKYRRTIIHDLGEKGTAELRPDSPLWIFPFPVSSVIHNPTLTPNY